MTPATQSDESELRLQRIINLIDDLDRLKGNPEARQIAIERMRTELDEARKPSPHDSRH